MRNFKKIFSSFVVFAVLGMTGAAFAQDVKVETFTEEKIVWVEKEVVVDNSKNPTEAKVIVHTAEQPNSGNSIQGAAGERAWQILGSDGKVQQYIVSPNWVNMTSLKKEIYTIPAKSKVTITINIVDTENSVYFNRYVYTWLWGLGDPVKADVVTFDKNGKGTAK